MKTRCSVCGGEAYRNRWGKMLLHTTPATGGKQPVSRVMFDEGKPYRPALVCDGSDLGARP